MNLRIIALCIGVLAGWGFAAEKPGLSEMDVFQLEFVSDPQISPDGSRIAYVRRFADVMTDRFYSNLWVVSFDGSDHRPLTSDRPSA